METAIKQTNCPPLILASTSPRRKELLQGLGLNFQVMAPGVDEESFALQAHPPQEQAVILSKEKAMAIAKSHPNHLVIASDTVVFCNGCVLGKPKDTEEAFKMLSQLQGNQHIVYSGITLAYQNQIISDFLGTTVWMKSLTPEEIYRYIQTQEPMDKAGAYAIQGYGSLLIERIDGCYFNVMGMSTYLLNKLLNQWGYSFL
ncbi:MAG: Maf family protein [Cyanobacteria bacterium]|nr:Maf family protein [Cyanobacteriota bacterium]